MLEPILKGREEFHRKRFRVQGQHPGESSTETWMTTIPETDFKIFVQTSFSGIAEFSNSSSIQINVDSLFQVKDFISH
jgi:hypothetical protein